MAGFSVTSEPGNTCFQVTLPSNCPAAIDLIRELLHTNQEENMTIEDDGELRQILRTVKTVASVGVSSNPEKASYGIFQYLAEAGYHMIPVNPTTPEVLGRKSYPDLRSIPEKIDVVQVFRKPEDVPPVVEQAIQAGAKVVWMQEGIVNQEAAAQAEKAGLKVVMNRCMMKTHQRLFGGLAQLLGHGQTNARHYADLLLRCLSQRIKNYVTRIGPLLGSIPGLYCRMLLNAHSNTLKLFLLEPQRSLPALITPLVFTGVKTATGSLQWVYEADGRMPPKAGDYSIVTDGNGEPVCIILDTEVRIIPFDEVDESFAWDGGEEDRTLESWRQIYREYISLECARIGREPTPQTPLVCERFRVVYKEPLETRVTHYETHHNQNSERHFCRSLFFYQKLDLRRSTFDGLYAGCVFFSISRKCLRNFDTLGATTAMQ